MRFSMHAIGMFGRIMFLLAVAALAAASPVFADQGPQELQVLFTEQEALSLPNTYGLVGNEDINQAGDYVFLSGFSTAIFLRKAGTPAAVRLLQFGDPVPGYPGSRMNAIATPPRINAAGIVVFGVDFSLGGIEGRVILRYDGSAFSTVAYSEDVAPGASGAKFGYTMALVGINNSGDVAFQAPLIPSEPPTLQPANALFIAPAGGATIRIAGQGDTAPGTTGGTFDSISGMVFNDAAEVLFRAQVTGGTGGYGMFAATATGVRKIVSNGDARPEGGTFSLTTSASVNYPYFNNTGEALFLYSNTLYVSSPTAGLAMAVNLSTTVPSPPGGTMTAINAPYGFTDSGVAVFRAALSGSSATAGIFRYTPGSPLQTVAYVGQSAPGTTQTFGTSWPYTSMNGSGTFSFVNILGGTGIQAGIFQQSGTGNPVAVVLQGAPSTLPGGGTLSLPTGRNRTLNDGSVYFRADVVGGAADFGTFLASGATISPLMSTQDPLPNGALIYLSTYRVGAAGPFVGFAAGKAGGRCGYWVHHIPTGTTSHVVSEMDTAPEGGALLRLANPNTVYVNGRGMVAFLAKYVGNSGVSGNNLMAWKFGGGGVQRVVAEGAPEGGSGLPFFGITLPTLGPSPLNNDNRVAFRAVLGGSNPAIFVVRPGNPTERIAWIGESAPTGGTFSNIPSDNYYVVNDADKVAFTASTSLGLTGIFVADPWSPPQKIVAAGDAGPNGGTFASLSQPAGINNSGEVVFTGQLTGGPGGGVYVGTGSAPPVAVAEKGSAAPAGGSYAFEGTPPDVQINPQGDIAFLAPLAGGSADSGLFLRRGRSGPVQAVAIQGQAAPGTAGTFATFSSNYWSSEEFFALGPTGELVFTDYLDLSGTYIFGMYRYLRNNTLEKLVLLGDTAPDSGGATMEIITSFVGVGDPWRFSFWVGLTGGTFKEVIYTTKAPADIADFNGDGNTDIVWRNYSTGQNALWLMNETSLSSIADLPTLTNTDYQIGGMADFDRDGNQDIVWRNPKTGANAIWLMNGTSVASVVDLPALPNSDYRICAVGNNTDNEDYYSYIVWRNYSTGQNAIWVLLGTTLVDIVDLPILPNTDYKIAGVGDFNFDGFPDILWRNQSTGQNAFWILDEDIGVMAIVDLPELPNTNYWISAIGDFNRDGNLDIGWRNYLTGQNALWLMQGTTFTGITDLPALPNIDYVMTGPR